MTVVVCFLALLAASWVAVRPPSWLHRDGRLKPGHVFLLISVPASLCVYVVFLFELNRALAAHPRGALFGSFYFVGVTGLAMGVFLYLALYMFVVREVVRRSREGRPVLGDRSLGLGSVVILLTLSAAPALWFLGRECVYSTAEYRGTPGWALQSLTARAIAWRRVELVKALAANQSLSADTLDTIARLPWPELARPQEGLLDFLHGDFRSVLETVAGHGSAAPETLAGLARNPASEVRRAVARQGRTPAEVLQELAEDDDSRVRLAVAANPGTSTLVLRTLTGDDQEFVRRRARLAIARREEVPSTLLRSGTEGHDPRGGNAARGPMEPGRGREQAALYPFAKEELKSDAGILENPNFDLVVLEIEEARGGAGEPLEATVRIVGMLRGRGWESPTAAARWGWQGSPQERHYRRPGSGTRVLAGVRGGRWRDGVIHLVVVDAYELSAKNLATAARHMAPPDPAPWLVIAAPLFGWILLALASVAPFRWTKALLVTGALGSAVATVVLYLDYERRMSPYTSIRIDIFLVWPAVAAALAMPLGVWWLRRRWRGGDAAR